MTSIKRKGMKYQIELQPLAGRYVVVLKDPTTGNPVKVFTVNESAAEMIRLYREGKDTLSIAQTISDQYSIPIDYVHADVVALLGKLK